jgi:hypothetical protein
MGLTFHPVQARKTTHHPPFSANHRPVKPMSDSLNIGQIIEVPRERDAIHVAVAPVVANGPLLPGEAISLLEDGSASVNPPFIGVVDPFLTRRVQAGERFWMFLRPGTITSLRHEWSHPNFPVGGAAPEHEKTPLSPKQESEAYLRDIASKCGVDFDRMMGAIEDDNYISMGENESYKDYITDDFEKHCAVYLGKPVRNAYPFSCSC